MAGLTATTLLSSIRRRASIPSTSVSGSADSDLLALATEELQLHLAADLLKVREEYFARDEDTTIGSSTSFRIPKRALGGKLRYVQFLDSSGNVVLTLDRTEPERLEDYDSSGAVSEFYLKANTVHLAPGVVPSGAVTLRQGFFCRPSELTNTAADYEAVTGVSSNVLTVASGHGYTTSSTLDIVKGSPGFEIVLLSTSPSATAATTVTFGAGNGLTGLGVAVGDYICVEEKSFIPNIPAEFHPILAQRTANKWMEAAGDRAGLEAGEAKLRQMEEAAGILVSPRVDGAPQKIVARSGPLGPVPVRRRLSG